MMKIEALTIADNELFLRQVSKEVDPKDPPINRSYSSFRNVL